MAYRFVFNVICTMIYCDTSLNSDIFIAVQSAITSTMSSFDTTEMSHLQSIAKIANDEARLWKLTMEAINHAVLTVDLEGNVTHLNPTAVKLTGWLAEDAIGKHVQRVVKLVAENTYLPIENPVTTCLQTQGTVHLLNDTLLLSSDGKEYAIEITVSPIEDHAGQHGVVMVFNDVSEQRKMAKAIAYRASHDMLTGLSNRNEFEQGLRRFVNDHRDAGQVHALMFIDLDRFKQVNDSCGHAAGDKLLQTVANILKGCVRSSDMVARIGGDEFGC